MPRVTRAVCATTIPGSGSSWPLPVTEISEKDGDWRLLSEVESEVKERMAVGERNLEGSVR